MKGEKVSRRFGSIRTAQCRRENDTEGIRTPAGPMDFESISLTTRTQCLQNAKRLSGTSRRPQVAVPECPSKYAFFKNTQIFMAAAGRNLLSLRPQAATYSHCDRRSQLTLMSRAWRPTDRPDRPTGPSQEFRSKKMQVLLSVPERRRFYVNAESLLHHCFRKDVVFHNVTVDVPVGKGRIRRWILGRRSRFGH